MSIDIFKRLISGQVKIAQESEDQLFNPELPQTNWVCFDGDSLAELGNTNPQFWLDTSGWGSLKSVPQVAEGRAIWIEYRLTDSLRAQREDEYSMNAHSFAVALQSVPNSPEKLSALVVYSGEKAHEPLIIAAGFYIVLDPVTGAVKEMKQTYARERDDTGSPVNSWAVRRDLFFGLLPLMIGDQASALGYGIAKRNARRVVPNLHNRDKKKRKLAQKQSKFHYYEVVPVVGTSNSGRIAGDELTTHTLEDTEE